MGGFHYKIKDAPIMTSGRDQTDDDEKLEIMRHSAAHIMAEVVQSIFPDAKFGIGWMVDQRRKAYGCLCRY